MTITLWDNIVATIVFIWIISLSVRNLQASDLDSTEPFCDDLKEVGTGCAGRGLF